MSDVLLEIAGSESSLAKRLRQQSVEEQAECSAFPKVGHSHEDMDSQSGSAVRQAEQQQGVCCSLLWNQAVLRFNVQQFAAALRLFAAAEGYMEGGAAQARAERAMTLCCLGMGQVDGCDGCVLQIRWQG